MEAFQALRSVLPLAFSSGINLYLTILVVGLSVRFGWVPNAPPGLDVFAALPMLIGAGIFYILEFFADKIQFVDNLWDIIHTFIRPVGAVIIATASLTGIEAEVLDATAGMVGVDPGTGIVAAVIAGGVALISHGGKTGTRTAVNITSPAENLSNIVISLLEDLLVAVVVFLALLFPLAANVLSVTLLVVIVIFVPLLLRWSWFTAGALLARLKAVAHKVQQPDRLLPEHAALLSGQTPRLVSRCRAQNIRQMSGRRGYLVLVADTLTFTYSRWFRLRAWSLERERITSVALHRRTLLLVLEVHYRNERQQPHTVRFVFTRDREPLVARFAEQVAVSEQLPAESR